jgi:phospholipase/carboxylesterase
MSDNPILDGPRLSPSNGKSAEKLVILLHGYGADGKDLIGLAQYWQQDFPNTAFAAPNAPEPCEMSPFGRQWFSLAKYDPELQRRNPETGAAIFDQMIEGVDRARNIVLQFLASEMDRHALGLSDVAFVGFSQGTMVSLYTGLRLPQQIAGVLGYSGALVGASTLAQDIQSRPPVCLVHGEVDDIVPFPAMDTAKKALKNADVPVTDHPCPGLGHGIDQQGLDVGRQFLKSILA